MIVYFCSTEISSRTDVKVEGDKRLDKLESFLDKLHNKGTRPLFVVESYTKHSTGSQYRISNTPNTKRIQREEIISREKGLCNTSCSTPLVSCDGHRVRREQKQDLHHRGDNRDGERGDDPGWWRDVRQLLQIRLAFVSPGLERGADGGRPQPDPGRYTEVSS